MLRVRAATYRRVDAATAVERGFEALVLCSVASVVRVSFYRQSSKQIKSSSRRQQPPHDAGAERG